MVLPQADLQRPLSESMAGMHRRAVDRAQLEAWVAEAQASGAVSAALLALRSQFDDPMILELEELRAGAELRGILIAPERPLPALFVATQPREAPVAPLRLDVVQLADGRLIGGSTFVVSSPGGDARGPES